MKHLAAYLLLVQAGNAEPKPEDVKTVLSSVGIDADEERLTKLFAELQGKNIEELVAAGSEKLASVPSGGAAAAAAAPAAGAEAAAEEKKEEKKEEEEESDEDMGFGLFD